MLCVRCSTSELSCWVSWLASLLSGLPAAAWPVPCDATLRWCTGFFATGSSGTGAEGAGEDAIGAGEAGAGDIGAADAGGGEDGLVSGLVMVCASAGAASARTAATATPFKSGFMVVILHSGCACLGAAKACPREL